MALFKKTKKEESSYPSVLPKLPELPDIPPGHQPSSPAPSMPKSKPNALPRFPSNSFADKFSQNTIKDAVSGEKEDKRANDFEELQKMPKFPELPEEEEVMEPRVPGYSRSMSAMPSTGISRVSSSQKDEPVFIRLDKFEESMDTFDKIKKQLAGADKLLNEIKEVKEKENKELEEWQAKMQTMKSQIEKIDKDVFSKVE